ncbi:neuroligin-4, Y-linked [Condylostylus longicornis]|uniref:neuroligin-4, Y-linked n=1 Tax=Condylostylus longicornis TaxID=2530218 RepID=UPI00244DE84F|nr:neuroligin-4, Y-linked [Condylostylus longicornis]
MTFPVTTQYNARFLTFQLVEIVNGRDAPPVVLPNQGTIMGIYMKMYRTQIIKAYLGIPYAISERFQPPVVDVLPSWTGIRNASKFGPDCWQNSKRPLKKHTEFFQKVLTTNRIVNDDKIYDENCLYLNIFIPDVEPPMEGFAVIVWLHSGDFSSGSAADLDPFQLVFKQKVVVVTVAYRLSIFGFFTTGDGEAAGNYGLMDQAAALLWIKKNIKLFNGNENSITLMGHGSGSISVGLHLTSGDWSAGTFHRAIMMSGSSLFDGAVYPPNFYVSSIDTIIYPFGCVRRPTSKLIECLRRLDAKLLIENIPYYLEWGPVIDDGLNNASSPFIPDYPRVLVERGMVREIPLLIGYTNMEDVLDIIVGDMMETGITQEIYDTMLNDAVLNDLGHLESNESLCGNLQIVLDAVKYSYMPYPPIKNGEKLRRMLVSFYTDRKYVAPSILLANQMSKFNMTYVYRFDIRPETEVAKKELSDWVGVPHNFDLLFVWGVPFWSDKDGYNKWNITDKRNSDLVMTLWANFAKFSDPTKVGVYIKWDKYTFDEQKILVIDRAFNMTDDMNFRGIQFWNDYYPRVVQHAINCCNGSSNAIDLILLSRNENYCIITLGYLAITTILINDRLRILS